MRGASPVVTLSFSSPFGSRARGAFRGPAYWVSVPGTEVLGTDVVVLDTDVVVLGTDVAVHSCPNASVPVRLNRAHLQPSRLHQAPPRRRARCAVRAGSGRRRPSRGLLLHHQPADLRADRGDVASA